MQAMTRALIALGWAVALLGGWLQRVSVALAVLLDRPLLGAGAARVIYRLGDRIHGLAGRLARKSFAVGDIVTVAPGTWGTSASGPGWRVYSVRAATGYLSLERGDVVCSVHAYACTPSTQEELAAYRLAEHAHARRDRMLPCAEVGKHA